MVDAIVKETGEVLAIGPNGLDLPAKTLPIGLLLPDGLSFDEWQGIGHSLQGVARSHMWWVGDWMRYGEHKWGEMYAQAMDATDNAYQTLKDAKWIAGKFELSRRRDNLPWGHHREVAVLDQEDQERLLDQAESEGWSNKQLRTAVAKGRRAKKHAEIAGASRERDIGSGSFALLYADPPWSFETFSELGKELSPDEHYPVMDYDAIKDLKVNGRLVSEVAHDDAAMFMWCTSSNIHLALEVMEAWGFTYKTQAVWDKQRTGTGYIFLNQHEVLLYGTRGAIPRPMAIGSSVLSYPRGRHSAKPPEVRGMLDRMYPHFDAPNKLELFCRDDVPGWTTWGYEA